MEVGRSLRYVSDSSSRVFQNRYSIPSFPRHDIREYWSQIFISTSTVQSPNYKLLVRYCRNNYCSLTKTSIKYLSSSSSSFFTKNNIRSKERRGKEISTRNGRPRFRLSLLFVWTTVKARRRRSTRRFTKGRLSCCECAGAGLTRTNNRAVLVRPAIASIDVYFTSCALLTI